MIKVLVASFLLGTFNPVWAVDSLAKNTHGLDASIHYLGMIFGGFGGLLPGGGSQIAGHLSNLLSTVLFVSAGILWTYTIIIGVLNTASEGQFLGQKWSSMWVPVRTLIGVCLLMPKGVTGYSLIQVIVMFVVINGVHAANFAWCKTLDYLEKGGAIVEKISPLKRVKTSQENAPVAVPVSLDHFINKAGKVLKNEVCMMAIYYAKEQESFAKGGVPSFGNFANSLGFYHSYSKDNSERKILFPSVWKPGLCGALTWNMDNSFQKWQMNHRSSEGFQQPVETFDFMGSAMQEMAISLLDPASSIASKIISEKPKQQSDSDVNEDQSPPFSFTEGAESVLLNSAERVTGLLKASSRHKSDIQRALQDSLSQEKQKEMRQSGWIVAGSYYPLLARANRAVAKVAFESSLDDLHAKIQVNSPSEGDIKRIMGYLPQQYQRDNLKRFLEKEMADFIEDEKRCVSERASWITHPSEEVNNHLLGGAPENKSQSFRKKIQAVLDAEYDPILALSKVGSQLLKEVVEYWQKFEFRNFGVEKKTDPVQALLQNALVIPLVAAWMLLNFTLGAVLVYYVTLIPFVLFFFGSLTWFTLVIGAILAAPLVALGVMHPEGHDFFGQAEQATRLLAALFLRPMLMVFGLIFGMILCAVIFELFNYGYGMIIESTVEFDSWLLQGVSQVATTALYTTMAVTIVTRCFSLIYELPHRAFSWIGWQTEAHNEAEVLSQAKGSVEQQASGIGQSTIGRHPVMGTVGSSALRDGSGMVGGSNSSSNSRAAATIEDNPD